MFILSFGPLAIEETSGNFGRQVSHSQDYGWQGHIKRGHGIPYKDHIQAPAKLLI